MICLKCIFKALPSDLRNQGSIGHKLRAGEFHRLPAPHFSSVALEQLFCAMLGCDHPSLPWPFSPGSEHPPWLTLGSHGGEQTKGSSPEL